MITITAFKWVPPFAQGQVRDHRLRWLLKEVGWPYEVELIDATVQRSAAYRAEQPFGQVPIMRETGRQTLFETGAIILDVATRAGLLLPTADADKSLVLCWLFAALNSIEPYLSEVAQCDFFMDAPVLKEKYRPLAVQGADMRLRELAAALGERSWLVGDAFTIADLANASVMKIVSHTQLVEAYPNLAAWRDRCFARPAYREAIEEQCEVFNRHGPADMGWS